MVTQTHILLNVTLVVSHLYLSSLQVKHRVTSEAEFSWSARRAHYFTLFFLFDATVLTQILSWYILRRQRAVGAILVVGWQSTVWITWWIWSLCLETLSIAVTLEFGCQPPNKVIWALEWKGLLLCFLRKEKFGLNHKLPVVASYKSSLVNVWELCILSHAAFRLIVWFNSQFTQIKLAFTSPLFTRVKLSVFLSVKNILQEIIQSLTLYQRQLVRRVLYYACEQQNIMWSKTQAKHSPSHQWEDVLAYSWLALIFSLVFPQSASKHANLFHPFFQNHF